MSLLLEIFSPHFLFVNAVWGSLLMGLLCPVIGRHLVLGRSIMLGLALPQVSMLGIAFLFLGAAMGWEWCGHFQDEFSRTFMGALLFTIPTLTVIAIQNAQQKVLTEGWLAFLYLLALSATELALSHHAAGEAYVEDLFHGRLILVNDHTLAALAATLGIAAGMALAFQRRITLVLADREFALALRLHLKRWHLLLAFINGSVIGAGVATVGPLVTFGFLILPVMASGLLARSMKSHLVGSMLLGAVMGLVGFLASYRYDLPLAACVVAVGCLILIFARFLKFALERH